MGSGRQRQPPQTHWAASRKTPYTLEKGHAGTTVGTVFAVLWKLGLMSTTTALANPDTDELRRWLVRSLDDRTEPYRRMVFNAMVTNNDDHPRNHALLRTRGGWRLSPAYDIVPTPMVSQERRAGARSGRVRASGKPVQPAVAV
jgi:HipA-like C-terminal domain